MRKIWHFIKIMVQTVIEAKELKAKEAVKKSNYYYM